MLNVAGCPPWVVPGFPAGLVEPGLGVGPPAFRRGFGDVEDAGGLFGREADEVPELHELGLLGVEGGEPLEGVVEGEELVVLDGRREVESVEFDVFGAGPVAEGALASGAVDEDAAHGLGGSGEEVGAILPMGLSVRAQPEPGFVDEGGGLECLAGGFAGHLLGGHLTQLGIDEFEETLGGAGVAAADRGEDLGDVTHGVGRTGLLRGWGSWFGSSALLDSISTVKMLAMFTPYLPL